jgi:microcystin-dependent protein
MNIKIIAMKTKLLTLLTGILFLTPIVNAQLDERGYTFQGYAVNEEGKALSNEEIKVKFTINPANYFEEHSLITDVFGVFTVIVGSKDGTTFKTINYSNLQALKVEVKKRLPITAGYIVIYNGPMLSVPYAQYANKASHASTADLATRATNADKADLATRATNADKADLATRATNADKADLAIRATNADKADLATTAKNGVPVGTIIAYAGTVIPSGWLICNGGRLSPVSTPEHAELAAVLGNTWGGLNKLPDLSNQFLRGSGIRSVGVKQSQDTKIPPSAEVKLFYSHKGIAAASNAISTSFVKTISDQSLLAGTDETLGDVSLKITVTGSGEGLETRPENMTVLYIIKY